MISEESTRDLWRLDPLVRAVTFRWLIGDEVYLDLIVQKASRKMPESTQAVSSGGLVDSDACLWRLYAATGLLEDPIVGCLIVDNQGGGDGATWRVIKSKAKQFGNCIDCQCTKEVR